MILESKMWNLLFHIFSRKASLWNAQLPDILFSIIIYHPFQNYLSLELSHDIIQDEKNWWRGRKQLNFPTRIFIIVDTLMVISCLDEKDTC